MENRNKATGPSRTTNRGTVERPKVTRVDGSRNSSSDGKSAATSQGVVSVAEAVSKLDYSGVGFKSNMDKKKAAEAKMKAVDPTVMSALGVEDSKEIANVPSTINTSSNRLKTKEGRDRSSSRTRRPSITAEEKKQSIRDSRARARSRSRSNTRPSRIAGTVAPARATTEVSLAPDNVSGTSSITEKTKTSRRPQSTSTTKRTTQQLILLRHAARCPYGPDSLDRATRGKCPIHKQCAEMKELLGHMTMCQLGEAGGCPFPSCDASKGLLGIIYPSGVPKPALDMEPPASVVSKPVRNPEPPAAVSKSEDRSRATPDPAPSRDISACRPVESVAPLVQSKPTGQYPSDTKGVHHDSTAKIVQDPLDRANMEEPFAPSIDDCSADSLQAVRQDKFPLVMMMSPSGTLHVVRQEKIPQVVMGVQSPPSKTASQPFAPKAVSPPAEDVEMGVFQRGQHDEEDDALDDQSLLEMEQQSLLLQQEIQARRLQRAPKIKHKVSSGSKSQVSSSSSTQPSQTSVSTSTSTMIRNSQMVAREIKLKAEAMMSKASPADTRAGDKKKKRKKKMEGDEEATLLSYMTSGGRWARISKFFCVGFGCTIIWSIIALILLYAFGGETWATFMDPLVDTTNDAAETEAPNQAGTFGWTEPSNTSSNPPPLDVQSDGGDNNGPTMAPTLFDTLLPEYTVEVLEQDRNSQSGQDDVSPQTKAYQWIQTEQEFLADEEEETLDSLASTSTNGSNQGALGTFTTQEWQNRFALATFFHATSVKAPTTRDGEYSSFTDNWTHSKNWLAMGVSECAWSFYTCLDDGDSLWVSNNNLRGSLPPEMGMLTEMRDIAIINNPYLTGPVPPQFGLLRRTVSVNLQGNNLSGQLPAELGTMKKLMWLYLNNNKLTSSIPTEIGNISTLAFLWLNDNRLTGRLDPKMFASQDFKNLQELLLHKNQLSGPIPEELGMLPKIRVLSLQENRFSGTIPTTLGLLTDLEILKLHDTLLTGVVPDELCLLLQRGTLGTLTIDCSKVTCDCGCSCTNDKNELPLTTPTLPPTTVAVPRETSPPTMSPTTSASETEVEPAPTEVTGQTTGQPTIGSSAAPTSAVLLTLNPSQGASSIPISNDDAPTTLPPSTAPPILATTPPSPAPSNPPETPQEDAAVTTSPPITDAPVQSGPYEGVSTAADFMLQLPDFTKETMLDGDSPQSLALEWLQGDPNLNQYSLQRKLQRFAMVAIFYSTNGTDWFESENWLNYTMHECDWYTSYENGDTCTEDGNGERFVTEFMQWGNNLVGPLPAEISLLPSVEKIFLGVNNITSIPSEIGLLSETLKVFNMMHCALEGFLPTELGGLAELKKLDLSENFLYGPIPSELGRLQLETLYLNQNYFAGPLPKELFNITSVEGVNVAANALSGTLPTEVGKLAHIQWFNLYGNWIEGPIPSEIGLMTKMVALHASHNLLSGAIPSELGQLSSSHSLSLDIRYNSLVGSVPSELGDLTNLIVLALEGNPELAGDMPGAICQLSTDWKLTTLSLDCENVLCGDEACLGGDPEVGICMCPEVQAYDDDQVR